MNNHAERRDKSLEKARNATKNVSDPEIRRAFYSVIEGLELANMGLDDSFCKIDEITERLKNIEGDVKEIREAQTAIAKSITVLQSLQVKSLKQETEKGKKERTRSWMIIGFSALSLVFIVYQVFGNNKAVSEILSITSLLSTLAKNLPLIAL